MVTVFLVLGIVGIALLALFTLIDDHFGGVFDALGGGDWFSGASLAGFLGAFGFTAALTLTLSDSQTLAIIVGVAAGLLLGGLVAWILFKLRHTQDDGAPTLEALLGAEGTVIGAIPADGFGEVKLTHAGHLVKVNARASMELPVGQPVEVTDVLSPTAVRVAPLYR